MCKKTTMPILDEEGETRICRWIQPQAQQNSGGEKLFRPAVKDVVNCLILTIRHIHLELEGASKQRVRYCAIIK